MGLILNSQIFVLSIINPKIKIVKIIFPAAFLIKVLQSHKRQGSFFEKYNSYDRQVVKKKELLHINQCCFVIFLERSAFYIPAPIRTHANTSYRSKHLVLFCCRCRCCWGAAVVSDSVRPQRRQPTRLPRPWDSPGKNTGVGCHVLLQCMKVKSESEVAELLQNRATLQVDPSPPGSLGRQDTGLEGSKRYPGSGYYGPAWCDSPS